MNLLTEDEMRRLGLEGRELGALVEAPLASPGVAEARGLGQTLAFGATSLFLTINVPLLETRGVSLAIDERHRGIRLVSHDADVQPAVSVLDGVSAPAPADDDPSIVHLATRQGTTFVVTMPSGQVVVRVDSGAVRAQAVVGTLLVEPLSIPAAPFETLRACAAHDVWLSAVIDDASASSAPLAGAVAAGVCARLLEARAVTLAQMRGRPADLLAALPGGEARSWARSWTPAEAATVSDIALASTDRLDAALRAFDVGAVLDDMRHEWSALCLHRDDLEGVGLLLREAGRGEAVSHSLDLIDGLGRVLSMSVPSLGEPDEQLRRTMKRDPGAWWVLAWLNA